MTRHRFRIQVSGILPTPTLTALWPRDKVDT